MLTLNKNWWERMKKYLFFMMVAFGIMNAYAEGVVLSDSYVSDDDAISEEPFVAS